MLLLEYQTTPIKYEMEITPPSINYTQNLPSHEITRTPAKITMETQRPQMKMDSYERRASMGIRGVSALTSYYKQIGQAGSSQATANYASFGNQLLNIQNGANIPDAYYNKMMQNIGGDLKLVPLAPIDISWQEGQLKQQYEAARLTFDWHTDKGTSEFIPGNIKMNITQYPSVSFRYVGGYNYVPASANSKYNKAI